MPFIVEIWSDVVCPWCYLGKRRFESALSRFEHRDDVEVVWRSFELDPNAERNPTGTSAARLPAKAGMRPPGAAPAGPQGARGGARPATSASPASPQRSGSSTTSTAPVGGTRSTPTG